MTFALLPGEVRLAFPVNRLEERNGHDFFLIWYVYEAGFKPAIVLLCIALALRLPLIALERLVLQGSSGASASAVSSLCLCF